MGFCSKEASLRNKWNAVGKDVVVLHQFWRGKYCPNLSPFVIKVECFLRLAGVKYERDIAKPFGPNKLCPWITFNGEEIADSQTIIEHLAKHFSVDLDSHLSPERIAALQAARIMMEEQIYWFLYLYRYHYDKSKTFVTTQSFPRKYLKFFFLYIMPRHSRKRAGEMALHSKERQYEMILKAFGYLDALLGDEPFFGGSRPCTVDCSLFGFLMQLKWNVPGTTYEKDFKEKFPRLGNYCLTMKEKIYPDWNQILFPPLETEVQNSVAE